MITTAAAAANMNNSQLALTGQAQVANEGEKIYKQWFAIADTDRDSRLTGADAVKFFQRSGLPRETLSRVWVLSDHGRQGYLGYNEFVKAMRAIARAQNELEVTLDSLSYPGDFMPRLEGLGYRLEDNMHLLSLDSQGQPQAPPKPGSAPTGPVVVPNLPAQKISARVNDPETQRKVGKPSKKPLNTAQCTSIIDALKEVYKLKVKPLEEAFKFGSFFSPVLNDADFDGKPQVLLLGQYSTGKTTFIKHLIGRDYPGCHIGPEPTTDRFVVVNYGIEDRITPGNTLAVQPDQPYSGLSNFGSGFLSKFQSSSCKAKLLEEISIVDTPGVLSGEKQRIERSYDFVDVCHWFAARCDLIILLFDPHKLDISDEFKSVMSSLRGHDDKVRVVLNKADTVDAQQLMRVYGALMWSLGKVFNTPEVVKVYVGSFNTKPVDTTRNPLGSLLFEKEQQDLLHDLYEIPSRACDRKVNEFVKRTRAARTHMILAGSLRKQMPAMFGGEEKQRKLLGRLEKEFEKCQLEFQLPRGDLPNPDRYRSMLVNFDLNKFPKLDKKNVDILDAVLSQDLPAIMRQFDNPF